MNFKYKNEADLSAMTPEQRDIYSEQKRDFEKNSRAQEIKDALDQFKKDNPVEPSPISKEKASEIEQMLKEWKEKGSFDASYQTSAGQMAKEIKEKKERLKSMRSEEEVVLEKGEVSKALSNVASIATNVHQQLLPGIENFGRIATNFYDRLPKLTISTGNHKGTIAYVDWDESTTVNAAAAIAEGAPFSESTAKFKGYTATLKKIGDTLPVTEEFFEDEELAASELDMFLQTNVKSVIGNQVINGDGTGDTLTGLVTSVPAYAAAASGITNVNIYDLITKVKTAITKNRGNKYAPNFALMNADDIDKLVLAKDLNGQYLFPPNHPIYSMIIEDNNVAANTMVVGDLRYARCYEMNGIILSRGYVGSQFGEDKITLKARKRMLFLIRNVDKQGFRKVTSITTALTTLATAP